MPPTCGEAAEQELAIAQLELAIGEVNTQRSNFGAVQNRFESAINTLQSQAESAQAARGRIMDADFAQETANMSRANVLQQAGMAMLSQANQSPNQVLSLLR